MLPKLKKLGLILVCGVLFAFGMFAKVVQYFPQLDAQLRISNSTKIEKHQSDARTFEVVAAAESSAASYAPTVIEQPEARLIPPAPEPLDFQPFAPRIISRPPPSQI